MRSRSRQGDARASTGAAVAAFAVSMLSYPFAFGYALVLIVLDVYPLRRFSRGPHGWRDASARRIWLEKVPFVLLGGLVLLTLLGRLNPTGIWTQYQPGPGLTLWGKAMQASYIWAYYLWKPWAPLHLAPVYTTLVSFNPGDVPFLASAGLVVGLTVLLVWQRRQLARGARPVGLPSGVAGPGVGADRASALPQRSLQLRPGHSLVGVPGRGIAQAVAPAEDLRRGRGGSAGVDRDPGSHERSANPHLAEQRQLV